MTKKELVEVVRNQEGLTLTQSESIVNLIFGTIKEELSEGKTVEIHNFGKFEVVKKAEREGRNPKTGDKIIIAAKNAVKFKAGKSLSESVK